MRNTSTGSAGAPAAMGRLGSTRSASLLLVRTMTALESVVPRNWVASFIPVLPLTDQAPVEVMLVHEANPLASLTSTLPTPGVPPVIFTCPATSSLAVGIVVPMPTLPFTYKSFHALVADPKSIAPFVAGNKLTLIAVVADKLFKLPFALPLLICVHANPL